MQVHFFIWKFHAQINEKFQLTVVNLDASDNSLRIDGFSDFSLKHIGNKTFEIDSNQVIILFHDVPFLCFAETFTAGNSYQRVYSVKFSKL